MKLVAINGSPRPKGNTFLLLSALMEAAQAKGMETELIQLRAPLRGCAACGRCGANKNRRCVFDDDGLNQHLETIFSADALVFGSPSYFADMTAELKAFIDRVGYIALANGGLLGGKVGAAVAVHRRGGAVHVVDSINHMMLMSRMIVPGSTYWNFGVGREIGQVAGDKEAFANMHDLGETIAWLTQAIKNTPR